MDKVPDMRITLVLLGCWGIAGDPAWQQVDFMVMLRTIIL